MVALPNSTEINPGASSSTLPSRDKSPLGDGYVRKRARGINNEREKWSLTYIPKLETAAITLYNTLKTNLGVDKYSWTPPGESAKNWTVEKLNKRWNTPQTIVISIDLEEDLSP